MERVVVSRLICRGRMVTKVLGGVKRGKEEACLRKGEESKVDKVEGDSAIVVVPVRFERAKMKEAKKEKDERKKKKKKRSAVEQLNVMMNNYEKDKRKGWKGKEEKKDPGYEMEEHWFYMFLRSICQSTSCTPPLLQ